MFICLPKKEIFTRHTEKNIPIIYRRPYPWYLTPYQWYFYALPMAFFDPHGKLTPGSIFIHGILPPPLLKIEPPHF
jgi:hypothetical protein